MIYCRQGGERGQRRRWGNWRISGDLETHRQSGVYRSTEVGQQIMQYATQNIIPVTLELGGKSPNIFFADVMDEEDAFFDKALEGFALFAFNQGEVCTCPSRALVQESIYERFMERAIRRVESIRSGNPLDSVTQMGAQVSHGQLETILNYIDIGKKEGADVLTAGDASCWKAN